MSPSKIVELSSSIATNTKLVDDYLSENGLPTPSFDASYPPDLPLPPHITQAKQTVLEAMDELEALLLGPMPKIFNDLVVRLTGQTSLHAIAKFKLANNVPFDSTITIPELAKTSGLDEGDCNRLISHALTNRLFVEEEPGVIKHSAMTSAIVNVPLFRDWIEETCENMWSSAPRIVSAMEKWPGSEEPNETAYNLARHTELPFFADISADKSGMRAKRFADSMSFFQANPTMRTSLIVDNYDWASHKVVVDVGGSQGDVALGLVKRFPEIKCVVQDLPEVIAGAPKDVERVEFQGYDFFTEQPVKDADVYLFRMIFHNWGDKYCIQILKNLIPALKNGTKLVINDHVVPEPGVLSPFNYRSVRAFDLVMKECFNAKERDINDWTALLKKADERFVIADVKRPEGSQLQIIEVNWEG
ncbi:S-adenosyl-L-methionine-dependent methyltransferase [Pleomassaria siparia CBS 279.74]|uniref:S-adenosyl-L-methionine-dependent methyltransferase n=1 Tax=Pleomassaria siparia CBS 279.74 TaxID=1314801 RepID=A0A6G1K441_9PLEO|nr:S-adenosyl-L-methionine-dependent methyltransferase [Pleomassaria siparia CBS 279.74]